MHNKEFLSEPEISPLRQEINNYYFINEEEVVLEVLKLANLDNDKLKSITNTSEKIVKEFRKVREESKGLDAFLFEYDLSSEEGITLMCLAEALLRIPDSTNIDKLIKDKISEADWEKHKGKSKSNFVNAATWALMLTGKIINKKQLSTNTLTNTFKNLVCRVGEPIVRQAIKQAMEILSKQYIMGNTIEAAIKRSKKQEKKGFWYSYDMLGEAACTMPDAEKFFLSYKNAIEAIGRNVDTTDLYKAPGISVKLSALHPRYEWTEKQRVLKELLPKLKELVILAREFNIGITIDAEEAERLDISLDLIEEILKDDVTSGWNGFGLAVQAYQKRSIKVIEWLSETSRKYNKKIMVRLVKGAYWDTEIKLAQERGLSEYPVFTRKYSTDASYIACAKKMLASNDVIYSQFATHNARTIATILELTKETGVKFEFQGLHGMGDSLFEKIMNVDEFNINCRIYAPVGSYEDLLPYLVRRLLENGANSSFVNRISDLNTPMSKLIADPCAEIENKESKRHSQIPLPKDIYFDNRLNSKGIDISYIKDIEPVLNDLNKLESKKYFSAPTFCRDHKDNETQDVVSPQDNNFVVGKVTLATKEDAEIALEKAEEGFASWTNLPVETRAKYLEIVADLLWQEKNELIYLLMKEAGKNIKDAISEIREAIDFCRYYATQARKDFNFDLLPGPTGESNKIKLFGRGVVSCISPWNFPLAIFVGQVTAALVSGNTVIAKPASQTTLIAAKAITIMHQAGIPHNAVQILPGRASVIGDALVEDPRIKAVMLTGSTETAKTINKKLADRDGPIIPFIAETGGQNTMIVDSSALPEQVVKDVILSAFGSCGQRCSALRVLYLQQDVADKIITMLKGAMAELKISDPMEISTDIGPAIDHNARKGLQSHVNRMDTEAKLIYRVELDDELLNKGSFFAPVAYEINSIKQLTEEVFGPVLHIVRFDIKDLDKVIDEINSTGYGLTFGIHSRINETIEYVINKIKAGNIYINRNMIGAVVGVQPFGGEGLSGTGPKAGGPRYLHRLATERTVCNNIVAIGGNADLVKLAY